MPTIPFTVRKIDSLKKPEAGRIDYWDEDLPGFGLRISSTGKRTWVAMYRTRDGLQRRLRIGTYPPLSLADARDQARDILRNVQKGKDPALERDANRTADTVKSLVDLYIERHAKPNKRSWKDDRRILYKDVVPAWGSRKAYSIRRRDVIALLDDVAKRGAIMANRTLEITRKMFSFAIERDILEAHPCIGVKKPGIARARERVLTTDEIRSVWKAMDGLKIIHAAHLKLRLITAQRGAEIRAMRWSDLDPALEKAEDICWWTIPPEFTKNGKGHRVPLTGLALDLLRQVRKAHQNPIWVFRVNNADGGETIWEHGNEVRVKSGVEFTPRDLRRTAATHMAGLGITRFNIARVLSHSDSSVTQVYDRHSYDPEKKAALEAWSKRLVEIIENKPPASNVFPIRA